MVLAPGTRLGPYETDGAYITIWSRHSRELFYVTHDNRIMRVEYDVDSKTFIPGRPAQWSTATLFNPGFTNVDLAPDGNRVATLIRPPEAVPPATVRLTFLLNFFDELRRRGAPGR
jgi:hypothetical protein